MPDELVPVDFPETLGHVWSYFRKLRNSRTSNGFSMNPLSYSEIYAFNELTKSCITEEEVDIIKQLDIEYLIANATKDK